VGAAPGFDVEFGRGRALFALAQGHVGPGHDSGSPADSNTGQLLRADGDSGFTVVASGLNQPTSLEMIGNAADVVAPVDNPGSKASDRAQRAVPDPLRRVVLAICTNSRASAPSPFDPDIDPSRRSNESS